MWRSLLVTGVAMLCALAWVGCGDDDGAGSDAGPLRSESGGPPDSGPRDAGGGGMDAGGSGTDAGGALVDAGPGGSDSGGGAAWQYANSAMATSFFAAGDCGEAGDYDPMRAVGAPNCTDCFDYCPAGAKTPPGNTPCSWFSMAMAPNSLTATFATPIMATEVRVWATYTAPPGDIMEVAVAASGAGPFTALTGGTPITSCGATRGPDDYTLSFTLPGTAVVGAVRVSTTDLNTGVDAIGIR